MARFAPSPATTPQYQQILGVRFFVGDAPEAVEIGAGGSANGAGDALLFKPLGQAEPQHAVRHRPAAR